MRGPRREVWGWLLAGLVVWTLFRAAEFDPALLWQGGQGALFDFAAGFWPPAKDGPFLSIVVLAVGQTLAMATAGVFFAAILAWPLALLATPVLAEPPGGVVFRGWCGKWTRAAIRGVLVVMRGIPDLVWALLFVRAVGLGATAAVWALAIAYAGMLGKVYGELFEMAREPAAALLASGSGKTGALVHGVLPVVLPDVISYTIYRWECGIRASVVMGFVGAGGLGQQIELSLRMFEGGQVLTLLLALLILVALADRLSAQLRRAFA